jgi:hypothetical protein
MQARDEAPHLRLFKRGESGLALQFQQQPGGVPVIGQRVRREPALMLERA